MIGDNKFWYLRNHKLFEQLNIKEIEDLCIISDMKDAKKNEVISFSDFEIRRIFILKVGTIKICREDKKGKEIITEILTNGDIFGHINATNDTREEYARVLSDKVKLCFFEISNFNQVLKNNTNLSIKFNDSVNDKLISFKQKYEDLIFKDVDTRVTDFFKTYAKHHGKVKNNGFEMEMVLTHQDIAEYTASSRQSVTTKINKLIEEGKIIYDGRKKVVIPNINAL